MWTTVTFVGVTLDYWSHTVYKDVVTAPHFAMDCDLFKSSCSLQVNDLGVLSFSTHRVEMVQCRVYFTSHTCGTIHSATT